MTDDCRYLLLDANRAYDPVKNRCRGHVLVSRIYDEYDVFQNPDLLWIEIFYDSDFKGAAGCDDVSGSLTIIEFHSIFKNECRIPIFYRQ